jgi:hypothetical protein
MEVKRESVASGRFQMATARGVYRYRSGETSYKPTSGHVVGVCVKRNVE